MVLLVIAVALLAVAMGLIGLADPPRLRRFVVLWQSRPGLWTAALIRLVFGIALWQVAPASRTPSVLAVLAVLSFSAGLVLPLLGLPRFVALLSWWMARPPLFQRLWSGLAVLFGMFLLWAVRA